MNQENITRSQNIPLQSNIEEYLISNRIRDKETIMLILFSSKERMNRIDAEYFDDHCLPRTIRRLQKKYGLAFCRRRIPISGRFRTRFYIFEYWLEGSELLKARRIAVPRMSNE